MAVLLEELGNPLTDEAGGQLLDEAAGLALPGSLYPIQITTEILLNGTWTGISQYVYQRDTITITAGSANEGSSVQPAQATLTLNNRDGRFSPNYTAGAYYPYLTRNVQLRISATATSVTGNYYSGYRFWGEVTTWPPLSDLSGADVYVQITVNGPLRRINQGGGQGSALTRYFASLSGLAAPVAYWPCEEDPDTDVVGAGIDGGSSMAITTGTPTWKAISDFNGSAPIGVLNNSTWDGLTGSFGSSGNDVFAAPGTYTWYATTTTVNAKVWGAGGGGENGYLGNSGGGGAFAQEAMLAVTPGTGYTVVVGPGGQGGRLKANFGSSNGTAGGDSTFQGDLVLVRAHGGKPGTSAGAGAGGTIGTNAVKFAGGAGNTATGTGGGAGGGSSAGTAANGNPGSAATGNTGAGGGAAPAGGGAGGRGGDAPADANGTAGLSPGGGGGGGAADINTGANHGGFPGAPGQVQLVYTPSSSGTPPSNNVIRFVCLVPKHGGNNGAVLVRAFTAGTVAKLDCLYVSGGKLQLKGYNLGGTLLFTSSNLTVGDGQTLMVSMELVNSGSAVAYTLAAIKPGASSIIGSVTGTTASASIGNVSEVLAGPNADVTKTAIGHISVQYVLIPLTSVSDALNGHVSEMSIDRFIRLGSEQALDNAAQFNDSADHWSFETSLQGWTPVNAGLSRTAVTVLSTGYPSGTEIWPTDGEWSLLITATGEAGQWSASSPGGTSGQPVNVGDIVSAAVDVYNISAITLNDVGANISWFTSGGTPLTPTAGAASVMAAGAIATIKVKGTAPATAAFFGVTLADNETVAQGTQMAIDHVRVTPRMGVQTRKRYRAFVEEIRDLDQGIMKELKTAWGLGYKTRIGIVNQAPAVTLDYSLAQLSGPDPGPLQPVVDDLLTKNHIVVHRHKGSKVTVTLNNGSMSVQEPPNGVGRRIFTPGGPMIGTSAVAAEADEQLAALAAFLLGLGTVTDERYPQIMVQPARPAVANLMSVLAGIEIGDTIKIVNLPFFYPSTTAQQLVIGYTEVLNPFSWDITWNCQPYSPYTVSVGSAPRRW